jgi:hypothetical protein
LLTARVVLVLLLAALAACGTDRNAPAADDGLARLDAAVAAVDRARTAVLAVPGDTLPVLTVFDDADEAAARGDRAAAAAARGAAGAGRAQAQAALEELPGRVATYRAALDELAAATSAARPLDGAQRTALATVAAGGRNEAAAVEASGAAVRAALPAYDGLAAALDRWLERARAGWYRATAESAAAYAVLAAPGRAELDEARAALAQAERRRAVEVEAQSRRVPDADAALAPLRAPR